MIKGRGAQKKLKNPFDQSSVEGLPFFEEDGMQKIKTEIIPVFPKTIVNKVKSSNVPMEYSVNPYQGSEHGCIYCYARVTHNYWGYGAGIDFETKILAKQNAASLLRKAIMNKNWKVDAIVFSGNTDCYQPIEQKLKITRSMIEVLHRYRHPIGFITKNALILRDLELLTEMARDDLVFVNMSISGTDEKMRQFLEPRTSSYAARLKTIEKLSAAGIPTRVMAGPLIPGLNDHMMQDILKQAANAGASDCTYMIIRLFGDLVPLFEDWLDHFYPDRKQKIMNRIRSIHNGQLEDSRYRIGHKGEGSWAQIIKQQYQLAKSRYFPEPLDFQFNKELFPKYKKGQLSLFD